MKIYPGYLKSVSTVWNFCFLNHKINVNIDGRLVIQFQEIICNLQSFILASSVNLFFEIGFASEPFTRASV